MKPTLESLEELAHDEPVGAIRLAETMIGEVPLDLLPRLLAIAGTAYRRLERLDDAMHVLLEAERRATDPLDLGDVKQRLAYVIAARGSLDEAIAKVLEAQNLYLLAGDESALGRALVDQGMFLFHRDRLPAAALCLEQALQRLGDGEFRNRFSALVGLALCVGRKDPERADRLLEQALPLAKQSGRAMCWKWSWARVRLLQDRGDSGSAQKVLENLCEEYLLRGHFLDASLAAVDLVQIVQGQGHSPGIYAELIRRIAFSLPEEGLAASALTRLWACCLRGAVRTQVLGAVREAVGRERNKAARASGELESNEGDQPLGSGNGPKPSGP